MNDLHDNLTLLVLCGGMGSRMRGKDKPLLPYAGTVMVDRVIAASPELPVLISANRHLNDYAARGQVFTDREVGTDIATPLNGVLGGLERSRTDWVLVAPGDSPTLVEGWWRDLADQVQPDEAGVVVHDGQRQQNLHLIIHRRLAPALRTYIRQGRGEVWRFLAEVGVRAVSVPNPEWFKNVNEAEDLD